MLKDQERIRKLLDDLHLKATNHVIESIIERKIDPRLISEAIEKPIEREADGKLSIFHYRVPSPTKGRTVLRVVARHIGRKRDKSLIISASWQGWRYRNR